MILAADNLNALNPKVAEAMRRLDPGPVRELAGRLDKAGADWIDVNPGYLSAKKQDRVEFLVEAVQEVSSRRLILDSPNPKIIERGLSVCRQTPVISAVTLEPAKLAEILPLAAESGSDLVLLLLDERSLCPPEPDEKIAVAISLYGLASSAGVPLERMIFDPVLPNVAWPDFHAHLKGAVLAVRALSSGEILGGPARTMAGISNLLSARRREYPASLESNCLSTLAGAGLEVALINALSPGLMDSYNFLKRTLGE